MNKLFKLFTLSILSCATLGVLAQTAQTLPPSTQARCVCMPGNQTGVLLKPGVMGVSSGQLESCPCVAKPEPSTDKPKDDGAAKDSKSTSDSTEKKSGDSDPTNNSNPSTSTTDADANSGN